MIEAVENHMPEVIVIDEIGTELEALAARTIAERGVQLVGTAHGNTLENLMMNPTLSDLIGGIQSVTLGDEEAKRRGTQKSILERKAPPTFDIVVEIQERDKVAIHPTSARPSMPSCAASPMPKELRSRDADRRSQNEMEKGGRRAAEAGGKTHEVAGRRPRAPERVEAPAATSPTGFSFSGWTGRGWNRWRKTCASTPAWSKT